MAPAPRLARRIAQLARHPEPELRADALRALGHAGALAAIAQPSVLEALHDPEPAVRLAASCAAASLVLSPAAVPALRAALGDALWSVRWRAAAALLRLGEVDGLDDVLATSCPDSGHSPEWLRAARMIPCPSPALLAAYDQADKD